MLYSLPILGTLFDEFGDERRPSGLMACAESLAVVAVEIFVERNIVAPVRIAVERFHAAEHRTISRGVRKKHVDQTFREQRRDLPQVHHIAASRRTLDSQSVSEIVVIALQRLDQEKIRRKPNWTTPV